MLSVFEFIRYHYLNLHREESAPILYIVYIQAGVTKLPPELLWNLNTEFVPLVAVLDIRTEVLCVFANLSSKQVVHLQQMSLLYSVQPYQQVGTFYLAIN